MGCHRRAGQWVSIQWEELDCYEKSFLISPLSQALYSWNVHCKPLSIVDWILFGYMLTWQKEGNKPHLPPTPGQQHTTKTFSVCSLMRVEPAGELFYVIIGLKKTTLFSLPVALSSSIVCLVNSALTSCPSWGVSPFKKASCSLGNGSSLFSLFLSHI